MKTTKLVRKYRWAALAAAGAVLAASFGSSSVQSLAGSTAASFAVPSSAAVSGSATAAPSSLKGVCPSTINVQTNWWPTNDDAFLIQLIGPKGKINSDNNTYSGRIGSTGVTLVIKSGGPAASYQTDTALAYENESDYLVMESTDEQIANSAKHPTTSVFAWYQNYPLVFLWGNQKWHFKSLKAIGESKQTVLVFSSGTYVGVFEREGLLNKAYVDTSYNGSPARFVAADGNIVQQGFITDEPYAYAHTLTSWDKPVSFIQVPTSAYPVYQDNIAVRSGALKADTPCLKRLVPLLQKAALAYAAHPASTNAVIVKFTSSLKGTGVLVSAGLASYAARAQIKYGLIANGANGIYGSFSTTRLQSAITKLTPVLKAEGDAIKTGLKPTSLATNEFLDRSIKLP
jgi:hypothetical protein